MERGGNDRRRREDPRDHRVRYERDRSYSPNPPRRERSRSPLRRDRYDDRRRDRSPLRGPPRSYRSDRERDYDRGRHGESPPPSRRPADRDHERRRARPRSITPERAPAAPLPRSPLESRSNNAAAAAPRGPRPRKRQSTQGTDTQMENGFEEDDDELAYMMRVMGFNKFRSTKNTKVPGNEFNWGVHVNHQTEYRQYMNRPGGFNKPLSPARE